jgi:hypothetical protein
MIVACAVCVAAPVCAQTAPQNPPPQNPPPQDPPPQNPPPQNPPPQNPPPQNPPPQNPPPQNPPPQTPTPEPPASPVPVQLSPGASKVFNPDMAVIGDFIGAAGSNKVDPIPALQMHETELSFQAIVDPYARADFFLSMTDTTISVEEGFITFPTLPGGLLLKVGKMKAQFGKVNTMHSHVLPWVDVPLVMTNLLGGEDGINDDGMSISKLILNPFLFLEATGEVYNGDNGIWKSYQRSDLGYVGRLRGYRDLTEGANIDLGTSYSYGHNNSGPDFTTKIAAVDATFRYRPLRRAIYRRFIGRTELMWSRRGQPNGNQNAFGMYASVDYQFSQRWFAGVRIDLSDRATDATRRDKSQSLLLTYWPSEFSQIRGQYRRTAYADGPTANELLFQFLFSIGAHGAHVF